MDEIGRVEVRIRQRRTRSQAKLTGAVAAIVGDMLARWAQEPAIPVFHSLHKTQFTGGPVPWRQFDAVRTALASLGYLHGRTGHAYALEWGDGAPVFVRLAARFWPAEALLVQATGFGVLPANIKDHFKPAPSKRTAKVPEPIMLLAVRDTWKARGADRPIAFDRAAQVPSKLRDDVLAFNEFAGGHTVKGCDPPVFKRVFRGSWDLGGRWTAVGQGVSFQTMSERARLDALRIDGRRVVEIDVAASHLSILHGLLGLPLPGDDPYAIDGVNRAVVKSWVTVTLGNGAPMKAWPERAIHDRPHLAHLDISMVGDAVCARYPFLACPAKAVASSPEMHAAKAATKLPVKRLLTHVLMGIEARALTDAMMALMRAGILALPMHDALLVPEAHREAAEIALVDGYQKRARMTPRFKGY